MPTKKVSSKHILLFIFFLSVFLLTISKIEDTDLWMHLSLGKVIWQLKGLPATEPYVYTALDRPFSYSAWLFGVIYYLSYLAFNIYGVILLKAVTITTAFYILVRDALRPYKNLVITVFVMAIVVLMTRYRFVERPDTFMMVFLSFSIFSLNAFVHDNKKYIYALPFVHLLWANSHSSIILMFIPFTAFVVGGILQGSFSRKMETTYVALSPSQIKIISVIFIVSLVASLINPFLVNQYLYGTQSLSTLWIKQRVLELEQPTWHLTKWPYLMTVLILLSFTLNKKQFSIIHFLMVIPFIALSFTTMRFVFILGIVSGPIMARNFSAFVDSKSWSDFFSKSSVKVVIALWITLYTTFSIMQVRPFNDQTKIFGFGINYDPIPENALKYMDKNFIKGRIFISSYWGGYINWRDFPKRSVFVDPRWYISDDLLEKMDDAYKDKSILGELEKKYGFESVLIQYPNPTEFEMGVSHPEWVLVYWDDLSLLYLKKGGRYDSVIQKDGYHFINPTAGSRGIVPILQDKNDRTGIIKELKRNIEETGSSKAHAILGFVYNEIGRYRDAIDAFSKVRNFPYGSHLVDAYTGIAYAYGKLGYLNESIKYYKKSITMRKDANSFYNMGIVYIKKGDKRTAMRHLEKALELNPNLTHIYPTLMGIYREFGMKDEIQKTTEIYKRALAVNEGEEHFRNGLKASREGKLDTAIEEYKKSIEANPSNPAVYDSLGYTYFKMGRIDEAYECLKKALGIDPKFASAHYGLALIYKKQGNITMAKKHLEEYLRLEPNGYDSKVKREMESLSLR